MITAGPAFYRASCDHCGKLAQQLSLSASGAKNIVLSIESSAVGRPWVEIDGKLCCDDCGIRLLGTNGYFIATDRYIDEQKKKEKTDERHATKETSLVGKTAIL